VPLLTRTGCRTVSSKAGDYTLRIPSAAWQLLPPAGDQDFAAEAATHDAKITIFRVNRSDTVDVNYLLTTSPIRFGDEGDTVMTSQVEDTQFSGHYAVICTYVIRRSSDPPVTKELGVVAMNGTVFYLDSTVMPGGLQAVADMVVRSFRQGTAAERGEQDFVPEPASAAAKIAEEDESKSSNLQDTLEGVGGIGLCAAGLATAVYLLAILCRLFGATWWPATGGLVSMAWWGSVGFVAVIGLVSGWIWPHYYKPKQFAAFAHVGAYQKQRWQAWFLAVLAAAALTLRLTLGVSWFFVPLAIGALVLAGIVLVKGGGAAFKTSKLIRSAGAIPERFLKSARDPAQIEQASEALGSGLLPATTVEGCQATEELLKAHAQEKAHRNIATCVVCGGYDRGIEKLDTCVLCHKPVCPACRAEATGGVIVCRTCHTFGAVCCSCGVYFRKRLSLASCRACYQHVCEQCAKRYTVEETYDPQELDPSWREIYRPYVVKEGRQQDWIPLCPACDPQKRQLFGDTSLGQAMRRKVADIAYAVHEKALADAIRAQAWQPKQAAAGGRGK